MKHLITIAILCIAAHAGAQNSVKKDTVLKHPIAHHEDDMSPDIIPPPPPKMVFTYVEQPPTATFDINKYITEHIKYPMEARKNNMEGRVIINFVVNEDGTLSDVKAIRSVGFGCDEEAVRVVKAMPPWNAARQGDKKVPCYYTLPVVFRLGR